MSGNSTHRKLNHVRWLGLFCMLATLLCTLALYRAGASQGSQELLITKTDFVQTTTQQNHREAPVSGSTAHGSKPSSNDQTEPAPLSEAYGKLPLSFEPNTGQAPAQVKFIARGDGYKLFLTTTEVVLALSKPAAEGTARDESVGARQASQQKAVVRMKLAGANAQPQITTQDELPGKINYLIGKDPQMWQTDIPTYAGVRYRNTYPGVDVVYYGNQRQLEYDFVVAPGADPNKIKLAFAGTRGLRIDARGDLILETGAEPLRQLKPVIYQEANGSRQEVAGRYVLRGKNEVGFEVAQYDVGRPLIIDPVLAYSTFLGGSRDDFAYGIAVDSAGSAYVTGSTVSDNFPLAMPVQASRRGATDVFITKLNPEGTSIVYSTYLGGGGGESGNGIAVDASGNAYVTGDTGSTDFPTTPGAFQPAKAVGQVVNRDAFVVKLNAAGNALSYSTYLGGSNLDEYGYGIRVDSGGNAYVAGTLYLSTSPANFPVTPGAFQTSYRGGSNDAFATKLNATGSGLVYSTYLGGSSHDTGKSIAIDSARNAYITGETYSNNFPTTSGSYRPTKTDGPSDAFVTKLNASGSAPVYSTYIGGRSPDVGKAIAVDAAGSAYITGLTSSSTYPVTPGAFDTTIGQVGCCGATNDAFVTKLNAAGTALAYSTFLGGAYGTDSGYGITVDKSGNAYVTGETQAGDFPVLNAFQPQKSNGYDAFVTELNSSGGALIYSSFLGGRGSDDRGTGIALDQAGNTYLTGFTHSADFPITSGAFQPFLNLTGFGDAHDAFVSKVKAGSTIPMNGSISGRIRKSDGTPLAGVTVTLSGWRTGTTQTDANGNYKFTGLQSGGNFTVIPSKTNYDFNPSSQSFKSLTGSQTANFTGELVTYVISGQITDDLDKGLGGVTVKLTGSQTSTFTTDSTGYYYFIATAEGNYNVTPAKTAYRFEPQSLRYNNLSSDQGSANFKGTLVPAVSSLSR